jgi:hypothetical protein
LEEEENEKLRREEKYRMDVEKLKEEKLRMHEMNLKRQQEKEMQVQRGNEFKLKIEMINKNFEDKLQKKVDTREKSEEVKKSRLREKQK